MCGQVRTEKLDSHGSAKLFLDTSIYDPHSARPQQLKKFDSRVGMKLRRYLIREFRGLVGLPNTRLGKIDPHPTGKTVLGKLLEELAACIATFNMLFHCIADLV